MNRPYLSAVTDVKMTVHLDCSCTDTTQEHRVYEDEEFSCGLCGAVYTVSIGNYHNTFELNLVRPGLPVGWKKPRESDVVIEEHGCAYRVEDREDFLLTSPLNRDGTYDDDFGPVEESPDHFKNGHVYAMEQHGVPKDRIEKILRTIAYYDDGSDTVPFLFP